MMNRKKTSAPPSKPENPSLATIAPETAQAMEMKVLTHDFESFDAFWPFYVHEHLRVNNRRLHFVGTSLGLIFLFMAALSSMPWYLPLAVICGYAFAWMGHFFIEHNRPATWKHPLYSFRGDLRMFYLILNGKMDQEIERLRPMWSHPPV